MVKNFCSRRRPVIAIVFDDATLNEAVWAPLIDHSMWITEMPYALNNVDLSHLEPIIDSINAELIPRLRSAWIWPFMAILLSSLIPLLAYIGVLAVKQDRLTVIVVSVVFGLCFMSALFQPGLRELMGLSITLVGSSVTKERGTKAQYVARQIRTAVASFYSCFISYSSKDQEFTDRLYYDLKRHNILCWYAPKDLKTGEYFRQEIEDAIRLYDKLLLVLSKDSVASHWVREEVEACLEREMKEDRNILFPIRIDDFAMNTSMGWAASIRRQRHVADFSHWDRQGQYDSALELLLQHLAA